MLNERDSCHASHARAGQPNKSRQKWSDTRDGICSILDIYSSAIRVRPVPVPVTSDGENLFVFLKSILLIIVMGICESKDKAMQPTLVASPRRR